MNDYSALVSEFTNRFGARPTIFQAPGRMNLIGEHTDYNDGWVLPTAIDKSVTLLIAPVADNRITIISHDKKEEVSLALSDLKPSSILWANYLLGVVDEIRKAGKKIRGFNCLFTGNIPIGAGLSSSAAVECAMATALNEVFQLNLSKWDLTKIAQQAEHNFAGVKCGIMDQFASIFSQKGHVLKLDTQTLNYEAIPFNPKGVAFVLVDSMVKHSLASSEYNTRRKECEQGFAIMQQQYPHIHSLRDLDLSQVQASEEALPPKVKLRLEYILEENERVNQACIFIKNNDWNKVGELLYQTHEGLRDKYEVSCTELDFLVDATQEREEVYGSRMMGGGFGGCTINIVKEEEAEPFIAYIQKVYQKQYGEKPTCYLVKTADGSGEVVPSKQIAG